MKLRRPGGRGHGGAALRACLIASLLPLAWLVAGGDSSASAASTGDARSTHAPGGSAAKGIPRCKSANLRLGIGVVRERRGGALAVPIFVANTGRSPCMLPLRATSVAVFDPFGHGQLASRHFSANDAAPTAVLGGHRRAKALVSWRRWCQGSVTSWSLRLGLPGLGHPLTAVVFGSVAPGSMGSFVPPVPRCAGSKSVPSLALSGIHTT